MPSRVWTKDTDNKLKKVIKHCSNARQLCTELGLNFDYVMQRPEYREKIYSALMSRFGRAEVAAADFLEELLRNQNAPDDLRAKTAEKLLAYYDKQKERYEQAQKIDVTITSESSAGMNELYAKLARISGGSEEGKKYTA